jgi:hypothetical protein
MLGVLPIFMFFNMSMVIDGMKKYGYPEGAAVPLLIVEILCALLYAIPQTATLGAILIAAYLGGAVATHVHASEFSQIPIPVLVAILAWLGLLLRDRRLRALLPLRKTRPVP